jgi:hypothetical protein
MEPVPLAAWASATEPLKLPSAPQLAVKPKLALMPP